MLLLNFLLLLYSFTLSVCSIMALTKRAKVIGDIACLLYAFYCLLVCGATRKLTAIYLVLQRFFSFTLVNAAVYRWLKGERVQVHF